LQNGLAFPLPSQYHAHKALLLKQKMPAIELDRTDVRILDVLQQEGRLSNQEIAERVALSPSPCLRRIKRLERMASFAATSRCSIRSSWDSLAGLCQCQARETRQDADG